MDIDFTKLNLKTERLTLRAFEDSDLEDFYEYAKIPGLGESAGWPHHRDIEISKKVLEGFKERKNVLAIEKDGHVIGNIVLRPADVDFFTDFEGKEGVELGFVLAPDYHRQGIMTEAVKTLISYAFEELDLDFVAAGYFRGNFKSRWFLQNFGFKYYGSHIVKVAMGNFEPTHETVYTKDMYLENVSGKSKEEKTTRPLEELILKADHKLVKKLSFEKDNIFTSDNKNRSTVIVVLKGRVRIISDDKEYTHFPEDAINIKKNKPFKIIPRSAAKLVLVEIGS